MGAARRALVGLVVAGAALGVAGPAVAKDFVVTKRGDPPPKACKPRDCSLREAVIAANKRPGADRVILPQARAYNLRIANTGPTGEDAAREGDLDVTGPLAILHPGRGKARVSANGIDRALEVHDGAPTTVRRLVITGGRLEAGADPRGAGIRTTSNLTLVGSTIRGNHAVADDGGGIAAHGGTVRLRRTAVTGNRTGGSAGAIDVGLSVEGLVLARSRLSGNLADFGGAMYIHNGDRVRIRASTIANNRADDIGGIYISEGQVDLRIVSSTLSGNRGTDEGGALHAFRGNVTITNSTITGNASGAEGGGIYADDGTVTLNAVTVTRNVARTGGGLYRDPSPSGSVTVRNSLIGLNTASIAGPDCAGEPFTSLGSNLLSTGSGCAGFDGPTDFVRPNPRLGKLRNNGGPTKTIALLKRSPAIGKAHRPSATKRDQRGRKRDRKPDIGAYER